MWYHITRQRVCTIVHKQAHCTIIIMNIMIISMMLYDTFIISWFDLIYPSASFGEQFVRRT